MLGSDMKVGPRHAHNPVLIRWPTKAKIQVYLARNGYEIGNVANPFFSTSGNYIWGYK